MRIDQIWRELEKDSSNTAGLILRRYSSNILPDVYAAVKKPENSRCIAVSLQSSAEINVNRFNNLRDIEIEIDSNIVQGRKLLLIRLISGQHTDIFSVLGEDLIDRIKNISSEEMLVRELLNRFEKWKSLFERSNDDCLTTEMQRGLYGELYLLRKLLSLAVNRISVIRSWTGPERLPKDFQNQLWAIEVKTTQGAKTDIIINGVSQLDTTNLHALYLYNLRLDKRFNDGETLNQIVDSILFLLQEDFISNAAFQAKLLEAGYFARHREIYAADGYLIRDENFYKVSDGFPRIEETEIRRGVSGVVYSVDLSGCAANIVNEGEVLQTIAF